MHQPGQKQPRLIIERPDMSVANKAEKHATPAQISLAWMLCKRPWIVPIPGTRKETRMKENAGAADVALSPGEVKALDDALDTMEMSAVFGGTPVGKGA